MTTIQYGDAYFFWPEVFALDMLKAVTAYEQLLVTPHPALHSVVTLTDLKASWFRRTHWSLLDVSELLLVCTCRTEQGRT